MLAYKNRFHGHGSLKYVYKNGRAIRGRLLTIKTSQNARRSRPRIAIVVSKKVLKSAVGRNRIRRRLYEIMRLLVSDINPPGVDIVCIVTSNDIRTMNHDELSAVVCSLLKEAGIYKNTL